MGRLKAGMSNLFGKGQEQSLWNVSWPAGVKIAISSIPDDPKLLWKF